MRHRRAGRLKCTGLCLAGLMFALGAVTNPSAQSVSQESVPAEGSPAAQSTTFRSGVTLIRTDVIVRDAEGVFLPDLTPSDFYIEEDGVAQEVASLVLVHGGRVFNQLTPPSAVQEGIILPARQPVDRTAGRIIIFFIDAMHLQAQSTPRVRHFIKKVADVLVHEGDLVGLISNNSAGTVVDLTYDRALLDSAADNIIGTGFGPRELIMDMQNGSRGPAELRWRAHRAFFTVNTLLQSLENIQDRRKILLYISTGYDLNPFALQRLHRDNRADQFLRDRGTDLADGIGSAGVPASLLDPFEQVERQGAVFADGELIGEMNELTQAANRANTTFYTMDPRGLISSPDIDFNVPFDAWAEYIATTRSSLRTLAQLTGGIAIVNTNNFDEMLREIDAATSDYYVLGFYTNNLDPTHRTRALDVSVAGRGDVSVQARTSYTFNRNAVETR